MEVMEMEGNRLNLWLFDTHEGQEFQDIMRWEQREDKGVKRGGVEKCHLALFYPPFSDPLPALSSLW